MSSGLAVSTRPSRVMTATPTGASSAMVRRRSTPAQPVAATPAASAEPAGAASGRPAEAARLEAASAVAAPATAAGPAGGGAMRPASARAAANPAARWSRATVVRRAPSTPGTPRAAGASARNNRRVAASTSATGGRPHSPDSTTAPPSSCAPDGSNGSVRSTPASLRRIVASRCSTPAGAGLAATFPGAACTHRCASRCSAAGSTASCGRSGPAWEGRNTAAGPGGVRPRGALKSPPPVAAAASARTHVSQCPPRSVIAPPQGVSPIRPPTASQLPVTSVGVVAGLHPYEYPRR